MAFFGVTKETISAVLVHPNAERLELARLEGLDFQFVIGKGSYKVGDGVLYFPVDSILPMPLMEKMGLAGKLSGGNRDRVKTIKLRGEISAGVVGCLDLIKDCQGTTTEEITAFLGVTKYEPPEVLEKGANISRHPDGVEKYDIEGCERNIKVVESLMDEVVVLEEKVEGSNFYCGVRADGTEVVGQRSGIIVPFGEETHTWWTTARNEGLIEKAKQIQADLFPGKDVYLRGEIVGPKIQFNIYGLTKFKVLMFDIKVNGTYLDTLDFLAICEKYIIETVPVLSTDKTLRELLGEKTIKEFSNGKSVLVDRLREGIVIRPLRERWCPIMKSRLIIKQRSPEYLAKES
jgi:RNA ligase (TIGR02306 family)